MDMKSILMTRSFVLLLLSCLTNTLFAAGELDKAIDSRLVAQQEAVKSQERIDGLADETKKLLEQYRYSIRKTDSLKAYNSQLRNSIDNQKNQLASIQRQLENIDETRRSITPLLVRMVNVLEQTISLDLPFLQEERSNRLNSIKTMMDQPDVPIPEKYRRVMEAYQIEMEYGRTIETYTQDINLGGSNQTVNILRIGRLVLAYQTLDGSSSGVWDAKAKSWRTLPEEYNHSIKQGMAIANKQSPPELFDMPVRMPGGAE